MSETRRTEESQASRKRDLASRVEEQSERIAALAREVEEARGILARKDAEIADAKSEAERHRKQAEWLTASKVEAENDAKRHAEQVGEVKDDARRMALEVVRLRDELKKLGESGGASTATSVPLSAPGDAAGEVDRFRRELQVANQALAALRVTHREVESEILALQRASNEMIATQYLDEVLQSILSGVEEGLGYDLAVLMVLDRAGGYFFPRSRPDNGVAMRAREEAGVSFEHLRVPVSAQMNAIAQLAEQPILTVHDTPRPLLEGAEPGEEAEQLGAYLVTSGGQQAFAAVPMMVRGQLGGAIFCSRARAGISARERESLQNFANQAGMAIENAQLVNDMRRVRDELARQNDTLEKTNDKLVQLERAKEALTSMMVHDMKNPLTSIRGYLELLLDEPVERLPEDLKKHVKISYDSSGRLLEMVRDLLDISKMEAGKFKLNPEELDLTAMLDSTFQEQSIMAKRASKTIAVSVAPALPRVVGDRDLISRVITNLVSNSVKHTPRGSTISVNVTPAAAVVGAPAETSVVIAIADNGEGIPKEFHEKIFEKFGTVETRAGGAPKLSTGLGLTFCKMAVEAHGGRLWLESEQGKGATFFVALRPSPE